MKKNILLLLSLVLIIASCKSDEEILPEEEKVVPSITIDQPNVELSSAAGTKNISFKSNVNWVATTSETWCNVYPTSGNETKREFMLSYTENTTYDDRSCIVTITNGTVSESITVTQSSKSGLLVTQEEYNLSNDAATIEVEIKANVEFDVIINDGWITKVDTRGLSTSKISFEIDKNTSIYNREGTITIEEKDGFLKSTITVVQFQEGNTSLTNTKQPFDLALIYTGGAHRHAGYFQPKHFGPYVSIEREDGSHDWVFDGFLFLEIKDAPYSYWGGHGTEPARKTEWQKLANTFFTAGKNIYALDEEVGRVAKLRNEANFEKRKVVIAIPEAKIDQKNWGEVNGKSMDFSKTDDRIEACKWYVDYILEKYDKASFQNIELVSFYWIIENNPRSTTAPADRSFVTEVEKYVRNKGYELYWIPNFLGLEQETNWQEIGYDRVYLQSGYFFRTDYSIDRLEEACKMVNRYNIQPYVEFDDRASKTSQNWGYKLHDTIDLFDKYGFWDTKAIAYYQGSNMVYYLANSKEEDDVNLYLRLANKIAARQKQK